MDAEGGCDLFGAKDSDELTEKIQVTRQVSLDILNYATERIKRLETKSD